MLVPMVMVLRILLQEGKEKEKEKEKEKDKVEEVMRRMASTGLTIGGETRIAADVVVMTVRPIRLMRGMVTSLPVRRGH